LVLKLRTVIKINRLGALAAAALASLAVPSRVARADGAATPAQGEATFYSTRGVLAEFFPKSERVTYRTFALGALAPALRARLAQRLGYAPARDKYTIFIATSHGKHGEQHGEQVDGYAVVDDEKGLHQPITFATRLSPRGIVERVEIMVYREPRGDEVRDARFKKQFEGKSAQDPMRLNQDIDAVSGATVSSASLATGVRRATILVEELALGLSTVASSGPPPAPAAPGAAPSSRTTVSR
jgi:hypothetical protein